MSASLRWSCCVGVLLLASGVRAGTVPIHVDSLLPDSRPNAPVKFGVPFPQGTLNVADVGTVRIVDGDGKVVPHQASVTATWDPAGAKGVRWLLVDMQVTAGRKYSLKFGADAPVDRVAVPDLARIDGDDIVFDSHAYAGRIARKGFDPFSRMSCLGRPVVLGKEDMAAGWFNAFYVEHETKGVFRADLDPEATVALEETGPLRATIKADGWYANEAGEKFCRYSIRMHFFRDRPDVRIEHTFIFTGLSAEDRIRAVGVKFARLKPAQIGSARLYALGSDLLTGRQIVDGGGYFHVIQDCSERGHFDFYTRNAQGDITTHAEKGGGSVYMIGDSGFSAAIRNAWQQYPWAMLFNGGLFDLQLWPRDVRMLDTTWDGYWSELTERQKRFMASNMHRKEPDVDAWMNRLRKATNATGAAKTHEVWLSFFGPHFPRIPSGTFGITGGLGREVAYPVLAYADPMWACQAEALDWLPHWPADYDRFPQEEATLSAFRVMMEDAMHANLWYGWWDWGGYHQHLGVGRKFPRTGLWADDGGHESWHRARPKSHYQWGRLPWVQYMRTGDRKWLEYGRTFTLYSCDRAHAHHTGNGRQNGAEYHYDNSVVPWVGGYRFSPGGDQLSSNLQSKDDYVYQYWLTGDRRALDVLKASCDLIATQHEKGGTQFRWKPGFERGNDIRNAGMQLERLMSAYQATWDERYLNVARDVASAFKPLTSKELVAKAELNPPEGVFHQALCWAYQGMWFYWNVTQDQEFGVAMRAFIDRALHVAPIGNGSGNNRATGYAYLLTKDPIYAAFARASWDDLASRGVSPFAFNPGYKQELSGLPGILGIIARAERFTEQSTPVRPRHVLGYRYHSWRNNPHYQGLNAYFREAEDRAWSFAVLASMGGTFELYGPDGRVVARKELGKDTPKWSKFEVPADGVAGDYTLVCVEPSQAIIDANSPEYLPTAWIVGSSLPVTLDMGDNAQAHPVIGQRLYFRAPEGGSAVVSVGGLDPKRVVRLFAADGSWEHTTRNAIPTQGGGHRMAIPSAMAGKMIGFEYVQDPDQHYEQNQSRSQFIRFDNIPRYVAANADEFFLPKPNVPPKSVGN